MTTSTKINLLDAILFNDKVTVKSYIDDEDDLTIFDVHYHEPMIITAIYYMEEFNNNDDEIFKMLLKGKYDFNARNHDNKTFIHILVEENHYELLAYVLSLKI